MLDLHSDTLAPPRAVLSAVHSGVGCGRGQVLEGVDGPGGSAARNERSGWLPRARVPDRLCDDVVGDGASSVQAGDWAACLMRLVNSVTWLKVERRSAMRVRIFLSALMTVV